VPPRRHPPTLAQKEHTVTDQPFDLIATCEPFTSAEWCVHRPESAAAVVRLLVAEVRRLTDERDALLAMVECCRELVPDLTGEAQDDLAGIVGWPAAAVAHATDNHTQPGHTRPTEGHTLMAPPYDTADDL
jgi:hypothetical protein